MFFVLSRARDKEKFSWGIEPQTFGFRAPIYRFMTLSKLLIIAICGKYINFSRDLAHRRVVSRQWSEHRSAMGIENFCFFVLRSWQDERYLLSFSTELKTYHLSYLLYISIFSSWYLHLCVCVQVTPSQLMRCLSKKFLEFNLCVFFKFCFWSLVLIHSNFLNLIYILSFSFC